MAQARGDAQPKRAGQLDAGQMVTNTSTPHKQCQDPMVADVHCASKVVLSELIATQKESQKSTGSLTCGTSSQPFDFIEPCDNVEAFAEFAKEWKDENTWAFALCADNSGINEHRNSKIARATAESPTVGLAVTWEAETVWWIPFDFADADAVPHQLGDAQQADPTEVRRTVAEMLAGSAIKIAVDMKLVWQRLTSLKFDVRGPLWDPAVAAWLLDPDILEEAPTAVEPFYDLCNGLKAVKSGSRMAQRARTRHGPSTHCCSEAYLTFQLYGKLREQVESHGLGVHMADVEMQLVPIVGRMELDGIAVDKTACEAQCDKLKDCQLRLQACAYVEAGCKFQLTNHSAVSRIIFTKLKLRPTTSSLRGSTSVKKEVLQDLIDQGHVLPGLIMSWRKIGRVLSKDLSQIQRASELPGRRIRFSCNPFTATGRIAVNDPNLQNIPKALDIDKVGPANGLRISLTVRPRDCIVAGPGMVLLGFDYRQIELRVIAHLSSDPALQRDLDGAVDIFENMAAALYRTEVHAVTKIQRQRAKGVCYGILYGTTTCNVYAISLSFCFASHCQGSTDTNSTAECCG